MGTTKKAERNAATGRYEANVLPACECGFCEVCDGPTEHGVCSVDREHVQATRPVAS